MKASGGKDIVLVPLVLARYSKTSKSGIQMGLRRRRTISNEIEHVGKQKLIIYKKTKQFYVLMYKSVLMYRV